MEKNSIWFFGGFQPKTMKGMGRESLWQQQIGGKVNDFSCEEGQEMSQRIQQVSSGKREKKKKIMFLFVEVKLNRNKQLFPVADVWKKVLKT